LRRAFVGGEGGSARPVEVTACWPHKGRFVLKLDGVDSIDAAEVLRGRDLRIPEAELSALPAGSYYHHQLEGLAVQDPQGRDVGRVAALMETGGEAVVLVVRGRGGETLIPLADEFVREIDVPGGRLVVRLPEPADAAS
jgi:16S rRNA processing protein RimM